MNLNKVIIFNIWSLTDWQGSARPVLQLDFIFFYIWHFLVIHLDNQEHYNVWSQNLIFGIVLNLGDLRPIWNIWEHCLKTDHKWWNKFESSGECLACSCMGHQHGVCMYKKVYESYIRGQHFNLIIKIQSTWVQSWNHLKSNCAEGNCNEYWRSYLCESFDAPSDGSSWCKPSCSH